MENKTEVGLTCLLCPEETRDLAVDELVREYESQVDHRRIAWSTSLQLFDMIGAGSQGQVFRAQRIGADGFQLPVAVKYFSPEIYRSLEAYDQAMSTIGKVAGLVATVQHENLLVVNHFLNQNRIRVMVMEWIDGFDLRLLLTPRKYGEVHARCSQRRWELLNDSLFCPGPVQPCLKPGAVLCIVCDCLAALLALHDEGILHNDLKPSNIMLNRAGRAKVIDIGSASLDGETTEPCTAGLRTITPAYAAPQVLAGQQPPSAASDIASVGYLAVEMLVGRPLVAEGSDFASLLKQKQELACRLPAVLSDDCEIGEDVVEFVQQLVCASDGNGFHAVEDALGRCKQLIRSYQFDSVIREYIGIWVSELLDGP